jgi:thiamine-phosphate pyrophosphorylase
MDLSLYLVTDRSLSLNRELEWIVQEAVEGGVTMVQLREKDCTTRDFLATAIRLKRILTLYSVPLIVNDRVDIAMASNADGLHIGQSDMPYYIARKLMGENRIIGLSVENMEQVKLANSLDVDYIGISPVFGTPTKTDTAQPFGLDGLRQAVAVSCHPTIAIGGINLGNANQVIQTGTNGIAVVSAICSAEHPKQAAIELKKLLV